MSEETISQKFDPNGVRVVDTIFGLPFNPDNANVVIIPVPWEVTASYQAGTAKGPETILQASSRLELAIPGIIECWKLGVSMLEISEDWVEENEQWRRHILPYIKWLESGMKKPLNSALENAPDAVNTISSKLNAWIKKQATELMDQGKFVAVLGGDHSTPYGLMSALSERYDSFGILHIDAQPDLKESYEKFEFSHASIMHNALKLDNVSKLVQLGIRDFSEMEYNLIRNENNRIKTYFHPDVKRRIYSGEQWMSICEEIVEHLPECVYISFDIDGLDPTLCPNTGTPVPGGLEFQEVVSLVELLVRKGKKIIGFDLCEVAPGKSGEWDGNVGARILYTLCAYLGVSQGKLKFYND